MLKEASMLILNNQVKKISNGGNFGEMWEVNEEKKYTVRLMKKGKFSFFKCDCPFSSIHNLANPECKHKISVLLYEMQRVWQ